MTVIHKNGCYLVTIGAVVSIGPNRLDAMRRAAALFFNSRTLKELP